MRPYATFLIALLLMLLLQNVQVFMCRQANVKHETSLALATSSGVAQGTNNKNHNRHYKRTIYAAPGETEEQLQHVGDQLESNYDEYPMVVPKRAELLLDRLMMALHRALEKERNSGRVPDISDYYMNNRNGNNGMMLDRDDAPENNNKLGDGEASEQGASYSMYSDDDPSVVMDYDFKDLNSINRATGESLMEKRFQRRALGLDMGGGGGGVDGGVQRLAAMAAANDDLSGGRNAVANKGRLYWRCYFNAVSCF